MPWNVIDTRRRRLLTPNFNSILPNSKGCPWLFNLDVIAGRELRFYLPRHILRNFLFSSRVKLFGISDSCC